MVVTLVVTVEAAVVIEVVTTVAEVEVGTVIVTVQ